MPRRFRNSSVSARILLYPRNRVFCRLSDSEFDDGFGWNLNFLLRLWIEARTRFPLLLHQFAKTGQNESAVLFDLFVREVAERIEEYSGGSFVGISGSSERDLKFTFVMSGLFLSQRNGSIARESRFLLLHFSRSENGS